MNEQERIFGTEDLEDIINEFRAKEEPVKENTDMNTADLTHLMAAMFEEPEQAPAGMPTLMADTLTALETPDTDSGEKEESGDAASDPAAMGDTIRVDDISQAVTEAKPADDDGEDEAAEESEADDDSDEDEDSEESEDYDDEDDDEVEFTYLPPLIFHSRSRFSELKRQLIEGPEKRYYELVETGVGKLQIAMFICLVVILLSGSAAMLYGAGLIPENRMRLMVFGQILAMLIGALMGSQQMVEGLFDLFHGRITLNTLLGITFCACCVDSVFCLKELRVPICAAFTLEVFMALWSTYHKRTTEMGQMDTMRKAVRLDSVIKCDDYHDGHPGFLRGEGQVEDFMEHYSEVSGPEKWLSRYAVFSLLASIAIAVVAGVFHSVSMAFQILTTSLLVAIPASMFVTLTRPAAVLQRKLHRLGTVLCGWTGVKGLCGKGVFPLKDVDLFPAGSVKMNGVKFYGDRAPEETISYAAALMKANGGTLASIFEQLRSSRSGAVYEACNLQFYGNGGIGGEICGEPVLMGTLDFLKDMGVEIPVGTMVKQAVYVSIDGELSGLFAVSYNRMKYSANGLATLTGHRRVRPLIAVEDFMLTEEFLKEKFGINPRRMTFLTRAQREELAKVSMPEDAPALALTTQEGLAPAAYAITGARALRTASRLGLTIHIIGGLLGLLIMLALAILGTTHLLTPIHVLLYQLIWMAPGLLVTVWPRTI